MSWTQFRAAKIKVILLFYKVSISSGVRELPMSFCLHDSLRINIFFVSVIWEILNLLAFFGLPTSCCI